MTTVRIIEDDPVLRLGIGALLREAGGVSVLAGAGEEAEVLLFGLSGASGVREVERLARRAAVVVLTSLESPSLLVGVLAAGARGLLRHGWFDADGLAGAVRAAARGQASLSPPVATALVEWLHSRSAGPGRLRALEHGLTPREAEIMELVAQGQDNRSIAARLFISEKTVKNHVYHIYRRLKADGREHAVSKWRSFEGC